MQITGKLIEINETQNISEKFQKREFVIEYAENLSYPEYIKFEATQKTCNILDNFSIGQMITIEFNLKGRKWLDPKNNKTVYFNSLQAWRLTANDKNQPHVNEAKAPNTHSENIPPIESYENSYIPDDLEEIPF
ncbi:DUF3127 domain-containing protein [Deltaproteobacteria bacterium TL4]